MFNRIMNFFKPAHITPTQFLDAARCGDDSVVNNYIQQHQGRPKNLNVVRDSRDNGALVASIYSRTNTIPIALINAGADVNQTSMDNDVGETPLMSAAFHNDTILISALLAAGADVNKKVYFEGSTRNFKTALSVAINKKNMTAVSALLDAPDIELPTKDDYPDTTPEIRSLINTAIVKQTQIATLAASNPSSASVFFEADVLPRTISDSHANSESSCFSQEHIIALRNQIDKLKGEIKSCWPSNKDIKAEKVNGLVALLSKSTKMDAISAVNQVEKEFPNIRKGSISTRTADLLDKIRNRGALQERMKFSCTL